MKLRSTYIRVIYAALNKLREREINAKSVHPLEFQYIKLTEEKTEVKKKIVFELYHAESE